MPIKINYNHDSATPTSEYPSAPYQLISNPEGKGPVEWCETCGRSNDLFWNGYQTICTSCDKDRVMYKRLKKPLVDEGITINEFFYRLHNREILFGWEPLV